MPPRMPRRALSVLRAIASPPGTEMVTSSPSPSASSASPAVLRFSMMLRRGTGLIAGPPTANPSPGLVTMPTPVPPRTSMPPPPERRLTSAVSRAPWVTSGSSPASLTLTARARSPSVQPSSMAKVTRWPLGSRHSTRPGTCPDTRPRTAAVAAAAALAPVVKPVRAPRRPRPAARGLGCASSGVTDCPGATRPRRAGHGWPPPPGSSHPCARR